MSKTFRTVMKSLRVITSISVQFKDQDTVIHISRYANNGNIALSLNNPKNDDLIKKVTINLYKLPDTHGIIKSYNENEGMIEALLEANIVEVVGMNESYKRNEISKLILTPVVEFINELLWEVAPPDSAQWYD